MTDTPTITTVTMTSGESRLKLAGPYHPSLPAAAKRLGGKFNGESKAWYFDPRDLAAVREMTLKIYGVDPLAETPATLVTVRVALDHVVYGDELWLFGRQLLRRPGRDEAVKLGDGVVMVAGGFAGSGGSAKYPDIKAKAGTIIEVRDVPAGAVDAEMSRNGEAIEIVAADGAATAPTALEQILTLGRTMTREQREAAASALLALD